MILSFWPGSRVDKIPFTSIPPAYDTPSQSWTVKEKKIIKKRNYQIITVWCNFTVCSCQRSIYISYLCHSKIKRYLPVYYNLKKLNGYIDTYHFKLEDMRTACKLLSQNCCMTKIDLKDAYFSLAVDEEFKFFLRFRFRDELYEFNCIPFGLCSAPFIFTKIMKPLCTYLRSKNIILTSYLDDIIFFNSSKYHCKEQVHLACGLFEDLGFILNYEKSLLYPKNTCMYLGLVPDSRKMSLSVPKEKQLAILEKIYTFERRSHCKIREFTQLLGKLTSICPAIPYGWVYTKLLERARYLALLRSNDNYDLSA